MQELAYEDLVAFATQDRIIRFVARERGKYAAKNSGGNNPFAKDPLFKQVREITPPHKLWHNPGRRMLPKKVEHGLGKWTYNKKAAATRVYQAIKKYRDTLDAKWVQNLDEFILSIQEQLASQEPLSLESPRILAKYKERDEGTGDFIYRPICKYTDLKTKIIIGLAYQYILDRFDIYFHPAMLFMRAARRLEDNRYAVPKFLDAIDMVSDYRRKSGPRPIYVGECDIQKFYDIFNHDVITDCFEDLFAEAAEKENAPNAVFDPLRRVIRAYLDSFNYPEHVMKKNDDPKFWQGKAPRKTSGACPNPVCRFKWVKEDAFISSGCYTAEEFRAAVADKKLGIPQGGALSGIIVNVVMRVVDKAIVGPEDPERLFIRYCDDILLMHTDRKRCEDYLECYYDRLVACKLVPHARRDVADFKTGARTRSGFWHAKSKNVYLWGSGAGDASDWVAFVGYEMRRTGEVRLRKDKIVDEFHKISHKYHMVIHAKKLHSDTPLTQEQKAELLQKMDTLSGHILDYEKAGNNVYTRSQARRLDNYLIRKTRQAARKIGYSSNEDDIKAIARMRPTYREKLKEKALLSD